MGVLKRSKFLLILVVFAFLLLGCGETEENTISKKKPDKPEIEKAPKVSIIEDAGKLVQLHLEKEEALVYFNLEQWGNVHGVGYWEENDWEEKYDTPKGYGPFSLDVSPDQVQEVLIVPVDCFDWRYGNMPAIFLLMKDGEIKWLSAILYDINSENNWELPKISKVSGLKKVTSLSYESDGEGIGEMTVFADTANGDRYDLVKYIIYSRLTDEYWEWGSMNSWMWEGADDLGIDNIMGKYFGAFEFKKDGTLVLRKGYLDEVPLSYSGTYELTLAENGDKRPGMITIDLYADSDYPGQPSEIHGSFFSEARFFYELELHQADGDRLFADIVDIDGPYIFFQTPYDVFED